MKGVANWIIVIGSVIIGMTIFVIGISLFVKQIRTTQRQIILEEIQDFHDKLESTCDMGKGSRYYYNLVIPDNVRAVYAAENDHESPPDKVSVLISDFEASVGDYLCIQFFDDNLPICQELSCLTNFTYIGSPSLKSNLQTLLARLRSDYPVFEYSVEIEKSDEYFLNVISEMGTLYVTTTTTSTTTVTQTTTSTTTTIYPTWVIKENEQFMLGGQRFRFVGVNANNLLNNKITDQELDDALKYLEQECGVSVIRIFRTAGKDRIEDILRITKEKNYNIKFIITLCDAVPGYISNPTGAKGFYTPGDISTCQEGIIDFLGSNLKEDYKEQIFAWELMNEPHCNYPGNSGDDDCPKRFYDWVEEWGNKVKELDSEHLIFLGWIGSRTDRSDSQWDDIKIINSFDSISALESHCYRPQNCLKDNSWVLRDLTTSKEALNKPFFVEESGAKGKDCDGCGEGEVCYSRGERADHIRRFMDMVFDNDGDGFLVWDFSIKPGYGCDRHTFFQIYNDPMCSILKEKAEEIGIKPTTTTTIPSQGKNSLIFGLSGLGKEDRISYAKDLEVTITRVAFNWDRIEPEKGQYNWEELDEKTEMFNSNGIKIVGMFVSTPVWASKNPLECGSDELENPQLTCVLNKDKAEDFKKTVKLTVERYPYIDHWEFWNEPEEYDYFKENINQRYGFWLNNFYDAVKEVDSTKKVAATTLSGWEFMEKIKDEKFDAVGYHPYSDDPNKPIKTGRIRDLAQEIGKELWLTEYGWSASEITESDQADRLQESLEWLVTEGKENYDVEIAILFRFSDVPGAEYGLVGVDYQKKPAYYTFKNFQDNT